MEEAEEAVITQVLLSSPHNLVKPYSCFDTAVLNETIMKMVKNFYESHTVVTWHLATDDLGQRMIAIDSFSFRLLRPILLTTDKTVWYPWGLPHSTSYALLHDS